MEKGNDGRQKMWKNKKLPSRQKGEDEGNDGEIACKLLLLFSR